MEAELIFNGNPIMNKKGNRFHSDFISIKYVPELKWTDLLE